MLGSFNYGDWKGQPTRERTAKKHGSGNCPPVLDRVNKMKFKEEPDAGPQRPCHGVYISFLSGHGKPSQ